MRIGLAMLAGCSGSRFGDFGDSGTGSGGTIGFPGIETLAWTGADGLVATWSDVGPVDRYQVVVTTAAGAAVKVVATDTTIATVGDLPDGDYVVRVTATRGAHREDGGRSLEQRVGADRLPLRSFTPIRGIGSVWGEGDVVVVAGRSSGTSFTVWDLHDPTAPVLLHEEVGSGYTKEVKIVDGLLFNQGECGCGTRKGPEWEAYDKIGVRIWDLADPSAPTLLSTIGSPVATVHNLWVDRGFLYLTDYDTDGLRIFDVRNPTAPVEVATWLPPAGFVHDQVVVRGRLYVSWWRGLTVLDVSDPTLPFELATYSGTIPALHNAWPAADDRYVFTTSETPGGALSVLDFGDPSDPVLVAEVDGLAPEASVHNTIVDGRYAYTAWYEEGVVVHDVSDPLFPIEVARYDTLGHGSSEIDPEGAFNGAWGLWPFGAHLVVADSDRGLFVFDHYPEVVTWEEPDADGL